MKKKQVSIILLLIFIQILLVIYGTNQKINFHVDEYLTFMLANNEAGMTLPIEKMHTYSGDELFLNSLAVNEDHRFDFSIVWNNQINDTHPPFYYVLIHTVCSLFAGQFSKWFGLIVNLVFFILSAILVYKVSYKIFGNFIQSAATLALWGFTVGTINTAIFIRMYMMLSFWILALIYWHLKIYTDKKINIKSYLLLFLITVAGTLTHYYFLVFLFFTALFYGIYMLCCRRTRDVILYVITFVISAVIAIAMFPAMIKHIFYGARGEQAFDAFSASSGYIGSLIEYLKVVTNEVAGNIWIFGMLVLIALIILIMGSIKQGKDLLRKIVASPLFAFVLIGIGYYCIIAKIAPYISNRYISPIYSLIVIVEIAIIFKLKNMLICNKYVQYIIPVVSCAIIVGATWLYGLQNTYQWTKNILEMASENSDKDVLYVYDAQTWKIPPSREELIRYNSFTFVTPENLESYIQGKDLSNMVLYTITTLDQESILNQLKIANPGIEEEMLYQSFYATAYML